MPITAEERAEINRQNAQKSTGPRTDEGKAASRGNSLKHGLTATTIAPVDTPGEPPAPTRPGSPTGSPTPTPATSSKWP